VTVHFLNLKAPEPGPSREVSEPSADHRAQRSQFWQLRRIPAPATQADFRHMGIAYRVLMVGAGPVLTWNVTVDVRNWPDQRVWRALYKTQQERPDLPQFDASLQRETVTLSTVDQGRHDELEVHALAHAFAQRLRRL